MKSTIAIFLLLVIATLGCSQAVVSENWPEDRLMKPAVLAERIAANKPLPVIINIGPRAVIPHSRDAGPAGGSRGSSNLKSILQDVSKDSEVVVYCGCCPYVDCPNIRPALATLKEGHFSNYHLLDLPKNIHADWISKGYPINR